MTERDGDDIFDLLRSDPEKMQVLREMAKREASDRIFAASPKYRDTLKELHEKFTAEAVRFSPGEFVRWKQGLRNKTYPHDDSVGIVVEHLETPLSIDRDPNSIYFREPMDLAVGTIVGAADDRTFVVYWFDSRRFERALDIHASTSSETTSG